MSDCVHVSKRTYLGGIVNYPHIYLVLLNICLHLFTGVCSQHAAILTSRIVPRMDGMDVDTSTGIGDIS